MKRDLRQLAGQEYDLLVIGGGIYGASLAWDAGLRGLRVALVEKADFCSATSANSSKIIHGGLRYLQHGDLRRMRESILERRSLMAIAPHLVHPLQVVIPAYGHGTRGPEALSIALRLNDLISFDRNRLEDPGKHIPRGRSISRGECLELLPGIARQGLTGGAIFYDAQVHNSERLVLSFLRSAEGTGAQMANYVAATGFLRSKDRVVGVKAQDSLTGDRLEILSRTVVNTAGPWVNSLLRPPDRGASTPHVRFARAINLVTRPIFDRYAAGAYTQDRSWGADTVIGKGGRLLFFVPWRGRNILGTAYAPFDLDPEDLTVTQAEVQAFLQEVNGAYPAAGLSMEDVCLVHRGLLPVAAVDGETGRVRLAKRHQIHDHQQEGLKGLISVVGVKYTTARLVAEKTVDHVFRAWGQQPRPSASASTPLYGGGIDRFEAFLRDEVRRRPEGLGEETVRELVYNYGSAYSNVLRYLHGPDEMDRRLPNPQAVLRAEILHGVREEMAQRLVDVLFRRTQLSTAGRPPAETVQFCAEVMASELGWTQSRLRAEVEDASAAFQATSRVQGEPPQEGNRQPHPAGSSAAGEA